MNAGPCSGAASPRSTAAPTRSSPSTITASRATATSSPSSTASGLRDELEWLTGTTGYHVNGRCVSALDPPRDRRLPPPERAGQGPSRLADASCGQTRPDCARRRDSERVHPRPPRPLGLRLVLRAPAPVEVRTDAGPGLGRVASLADRDPIEPFVGRRAARVSAPRLRIPDRRTARGDRGAGLHGRDARLRSRPWSETGRPGRSWANDSTRSSRRYRPRSWPR